MLDPWATFDKRAKEDQKILATIRERAKHEINELLQYEGLSETARRRVERLNKLIYGE